MNIINQHPNDHGSLFNYNFNNFKILFNVQFNLFLFFITFLLILHIYNNLLAVLRQMPCTPLCAIVTDSISIKMLQKANK